jgi:hypothetical protein
MHAMLSEACCRYGPIQTLLQSVILRFVSNRASKRCGKYAVSKANGVFIAVMVDELVYFYLFHENFYRTIHAPFQPFILQEAHGTCGKAISTFVYW